MKIPPEILAKTITWAEAIVQAVLSDGEPLTYDETKLARQMGVMHPERIRILMVEAIPRPSDPALLALGEALGLLRDGVAGLTLGYSVLICNGYRKRLVVSHECRHVFQYEQIGDLGLYLSEYLRQVAIHGYRNAPFEVDAIANQIIY